MTWWIVILLLLAGLSPLVWLRPSQHQGRQMAMRLAARRMGLAMQLARQDWPHWLPQEPPSPCAQYHSPRRSGHADSWSYWQLAPGQWVNQWREPCADAALLERLAGLPADVYKVEASKQMIALYWGERGEPEVLQRIAAALQALA
ncbi:hypothetical protein D3880_14255 [Pseudomonas cavernae]|uniref:Preprotein translocase subunit YajC n=1 Tax=Pseudomonas cavernae TaxID=2320867 RepID=A0A385Z735_9PSED|nr:hypothetical protein [Pseudomonas cavernae]AYC33448.1 hypothetical protein D3880_14255 [Pseudomonas cavernae]